MVLSLVATPLVIIPFRGSLDEINFDHTLKTTNILYVKYQIFRRNHLKRVTSLGSDVIFSAVTLNKMALYDFACWTE